MPLETQAGSVCESQTPQLPGFYSGWVFPLRQVPVLALTAAGYPRGGLGILLLEVLLAFISLLSSPDRQESTVGIWAVISFFLALGGDVLTWL